MPQLCLGMFLSVVCAEDAPFYDEETIARESAGTPLGGTMSRSILEACKHWPRGRIPDDFKQPVRSRVPVLMISGESDPVTPPHLSTALEETLSRSLHLVLPDTAHSALAPGCVADLIDRFVETGKTEKLETACVRDLRRPSFSIGR